MKKIIPILLLLLAAAVLSGCNRNSGSFPGEVNFDKDQSYALGMSIGFSLRDSMMADGIVPNLDEFMKGFRDSLSAADLRLSYDEAADLLNTAFETLASEMYGPAIEEENAFLAGNSQKAGIITTSSGLQYEVLEEGDGPKPNIEDTVLVHYEGRLIDGTVFDSTYMWEEPVDFPLYMVIPGWAEGIMLMNVGSTYRLYIPSNLGYGASGIQGYIPPYAVLIFDVELLEILEDSYYDWSGW